MDNGTIRCTNCGATCKAKDEYCKSCWKRISIEAEPGDSVAEGMNQSEWVDWELFIDKNADRYIDVYKKNQNKKIFAHMNWSAFFFGMSWALYRRMFKFAVICFFITSLISVSLFAIFMLPHREEIRVLNESVERYKTYLDRGGETVLIDAQGEPYSPEIVQKGAKAANELAEIEIKAQLKTFLIIPLVCAFWGFFGDALYKMHIEKNIRSNKSGTSVGELIGGRIVLSVIESLLLNPVNAFILKILIG